MHDERRLLKALARRDRGAWSTLYDSHVKDLFGFVYHLVGGNRPVAEDLNQEVWLAALEGVDRFDPTLGRLRDWLMGIARHRVVRYLRIRSHDSLEASTVLNGLLENGELPPAELLENSERAEITSRGLAAPEPRVQGRPLEEVRRWLVGPGNLQSHRAIAQGGRVTAIACSAAAPRAPPTLFLAQFRRSSQ